MKISPRQKVARANSYEFRISSNFPGARSSIITKPYDFNQKITVFYVFAYFFNRFKNEIEQFLSKLFSFYNQIIVFI
jgi:hypothetical protein